MVSPHTTSLHFEQQFYELHCTAIQKPYGFRSLIFGTFSTVILITQPAASAKAVARIALSPSMTRYSSGFLCTSNPEEHHVRPSVRLVFLILPLLLPTSFPSCFSLIFLPSFFPSFLSSFVLNS